MSFDAPILIRMRTLVQQWEQTADDKALFLRCYMMMTSNMLDAISRKEFRDSPWVEKLLHRFADYYFAALQAYELDPVSAPGVWQLAHHAAADAEMTAMQKMLVGVNAHINYDLVLTLVDLLRPEWSALSESRQSDRAADHHRVNDVIGRTIDAVQDQILEPAMPVMRIIDTLLGPVDELFLSRLIAHWRENVWAHSLRLLEEEDPARHARLIVDIDQEALKIGGFICGRD